jgi:hypothetical protein
VDEDLAALMARLRRLEDRESIRDTWLQYCNRLDCFDFEGLGSVFTEDARLEVDGLSAGLDGAYRGRRAIIEDFYTRTGVPGRDTPMGLMTGHLSTNMQIELHGDEATTLAYFFEIVDDDLVLIGTYQHRMRRRADRWAIAFLRISVRFRGRLQIDRLHGQSLQAVLSKPV